MQSVVDFFAVLMKQIRRFPNAHAPDRIFNESHSVGYIKKGKLTFFMENIRITPIRINI